METLIPSGNGRDFNFVAFAQEDFEDEYFNSDSVLRNWIPRQVIPLFMTVHCLKYMRPRERWKKRGMSTVTGSEMCCTARRWTGREIPVADADGRGSCIRVE